MNIKFPNKRSAFTVLTVVTAVAVVAASVGIAAIAGFFGGIGENSGGSDFPAFKTEPTKTDLFNGFANVCDYGAVPNDDKDDTDAFIAAASTCINVYVPAGKYIVKDTVTVYGGQIAGDEHNNTLIECTGKGPIIKLTNGAGASSMTLKFDDVSKNEKVGKKIAIELGSAKDNAIDTYVHDVVIENVGTGIYSDFKGIANNETFENVRVSGYACAGIYLKTAQRYNTCLRSVYLSESKDADYGVYIEKGTASAIEQVMCDKVSANDVITLKDCTGFTLRTASFDNVTSDSLLRLSGSVGMVGSIFDRASKGSAIKISDWKKALTVKVDFVHICDLTDSSKFKLIDTDSLKAKCTVDIDTCTYENVPKAFQSFPCSGDKNLQVNRTCK